MDGQKTQRTSPILVGFAAIGMAAVVLFALFFLFAGGPPAKVEAVEPVRTRPERIKFEDILLYTNTQLDELFTSMGDEDVERFWNDWLQYRKSLPNPVDGRKWQDVWDKLRPYYEDKVLKKNK